MTQMQLTEGEYSAALERAHAKGLHVVPVWDRVAERTMWQVVNPKSSSVHYVRLTSAGHLSCDCASRVYCCCRAATRELLIAERTARETQIAQARAAAVARDTSMLLSHAPAAFSLFK